MNYNNERLKMEARVPGHDHTDTELVANRIESVSQFMGNVIRHGTIQCNKESLAKSDIEFMLDMVADFAKALAIDEITPEKKTLLRRLKSKAMFLDIVKKHGGAFSSAEVAKILGVSKVTVKNRKDAGKVLALNIDGEFYYPVFQFVKDENSADHRVLKGMDTLLPQLQGFSDRLQYSFFMEERNTVLNGLLPQGRTFTVANLLREGVSDQVMQEIHRLARLYCTQDAA